VVVQTRYAFQVDFFGGAVVTLDLDAMNADKTVGYANVEHTGIGEQQRMWC
jgi:hypothetical protein